MDRWIDVTFPQSRKNLFQPIFPPLVNFFFTRPTLFSKFCDEKFVWRQWPEKKSKSCVVWCWVVLCCVVLCSVVLCCVVLCCVVLCCVVLYSDRSCHHISFHFQGFLVFFRVPQREARDDCGYIVDFEFGAGVAPFAVGVGSECLCRSSGNTMSIKDRLRLLRLLSTQVDT